MSHHFQPFESVSIEPPAFSFSSKSYPFPSSTSQKAQSYTHNSPYKPTAVSPHENCHLHP